VGGKPGTGREGCGQRVIFAAGQHPYQRPGQPYWFNVISWPGVTGRPGRSGRIRPPGGG
jgi:hypothetical protein